MYEAHFGFSGPPFQLVPDPGFFFGSRGHSNALAFLQSAAQQGDGFLVVTGEIGAGKTTLVRTLLEGLDADQVKAATMVSTQLEAGELPQAILLTFGATPTGKTHTKLSAHLEAYLIDLANQGRRALLIVDEAQNLGQGIIEELRLLSNLQLGAKPLLQVFLVGQPELRTLIQGKAMEQLRQRVTASCHLGPLDANETQAYVQHRLRRVGWVQNPAIETQAYAALHEWTAGIPRRINRLCNRLLLAAFLERRDAITAETVEQVARDLRSEIGESDEQPRLQESFVSAPVVPQPHGVGSVGTPSLAAPVLAESSRQSVPVGTAKPVVQVPVTEEDEESDSRFDSSFGSDWCELPVAPKLAVVQTHSPADDTRGSPSNPQGQSSAAALPQERPEASALRRPLPGQSTPNIVAAHETPLAPGGAKRAKDKGDAPSEASAAPALPPVAKHPAKAPKGDAAARSTKPEPPHAADRPAAVSEARAVTTPPAIRAPLLEPLVLLVDSVGEYVKARALGLALSEVRNLPPTLIVNTGSLASLQVGEELSGVLPLTMPDVHLDINEQGGAASAALAITRLDALLRAHRPKALLAMGASDTLLTCSLFAHKSGVPVLRNDAGRRRAWSRPGEEMNAVLLENLADCAYISDLATYYTLYRMGIPTERVLLVGNLADNVMHRAAMHLVNPRDILTRAGVATETFTAATGYALCTAQIESSRSAHDEGLELIAMLTQVTRDVPVVWATNPATLREIDVLGKRTALAKARVELAPALAYLDCIDLLREARCLLTGSAGRFLDDAVALGKPAIVLGKGIVVPVKSTEALQLSTALPAGKLLEVLAEVLAHEPEARETPAFWDGGPAGRIALHLAEWLPKQITAGKRSSPAAPIQAVERVRGESVVEGADAG